MEPRAKEMTEDMKSAGRQAKEAATQAAEDISARARQAKEAAMEGARAAYQAAQTKARAGARATDEAIREYPHASLGIAFGAGILLGILLKRK